MVYLNLRNSCVFSLSSASRRLILPSYLWTASFWLFSWSRRVSMALISSEILIKKISKSNYYWTSLLVENDDKNVLHQFSSFSTFACYGGYNSVISKIFIDFLFKSSNCTKKQFKKYGFTFQFLYDKIDQNTNLVKFPSAKWLFWYNCKF